MAVPVQWVEAGGGPAEALTRTHILIMALDAVIDELPPDADVETLVG
jgi:hypothetical protein